jgi:hypothetical protein
VGHPLAGEGEIHRWAELGGLDPTPWLALAAAVADPARRPAALRAAGEMVARRGIWQSFAVQFYAQLGAHDRALDLLEQMHQQRSGYLPHIGTDPALEPLRSDPRLQRLVRELKLP